MTYLDKVADERVSDARCTDESLIVDLMDGRMISVPLAWYPRLPHATSEHSAPSGRHAEAATAFTGRRSTKT